MIKKIISLINAIILCFTMFINSLTSVYEGVVFTIDAEKTGAVLGNKVNNINCWSYASAPEAEKISGYTDISFVEYIQIMQATGGNADRDLFIDPNDRTTMTDYDFTKLIKSCEGILAVGAKPHIKTGNVPLKMNANPNIGVFGVNTCAPDDFNIYYNYITAIAKALVERFGKAEVQSWRFGCLTEYENKDWFVDSTNNAEKTKNDFFKLYDYTVAALQSEIGENISVGAHSMSCSEGLWDERDFIEHCANGTNYKTGQKGTRLCFLNVSFYDSKPGKFNKDYDLPSTIKFLRDKAESVGLKNLTYGVDEGRILSGTKGMEAADLNMRICGFTYQAGYDARLIKQMIDNDIEYFSSWGLLSNGAFEGYPSVAYHVANCYSQMANANRVSAKSFGNLVVNAEKQAVAGFDSSTNTLHIMAYNFKNKVDYKVDANAKFKINIPQFSGKDVKVTTYMIDDSCNYFDEWQQDRINYNITDDCFWWSPDDPAIDTSGTLSAAWARDIYFNQLRDNYIEFSKLVPIIETLKVENGKLTLNANLEPNAVLFYQITPIG